jgi:hypothetical protein
MQMIHERVEKLEKRLETLEAIDAQIPPGPPLTKERILEGVGEVAPFPHSRGAQGGSDV